MTPAIDSSLAVNNDRLKKAMAQRAKPSISNMAQQQQQQQQQIINSQISFMNDTTTTSDSSSYNNCNRFQIVDDLVVDPHHASIATFATFNSTSSSSSESNDSAFFASTNSSISSQTNIVTEPTTSDFGMSIAPNGFPMQSKPMSQNNFLINPSNNQYSLAEIGSTTLCSDSTSYEAGKFGRVVAGSIHSFSSFDSSDSMREHAPRRLFEKSKGANIEAVSETPEFAIVTGITRVEEDETSFFFKNNQSSSKSTTNQLNRNNSNTQLFNTNDSSSLSSPFQSAKYPYGNASQKPHHASQFTLRKPESKTELNHTLLSLNSDFTDFNSQSSLEALDIARSRAIASAFDASLYNETSNKTQQSNNNTNSTIASSSTNNLNFTRAIYDDQGISFKGHHYTHSTDTTPDNLANLYNELSLNDPSIYSTDKNGMLQFPSSSPSKRASNLRRHKSCSSFNSMLMKPEDEEDMTRNLHHSRHGSGASTNSNSTASSSSVAKLDLNLDLDSVIHNALVESTRYQPPPPSSSNSHLYQQFPSTSFQQQQQVSQYNDGALLTRTVTSNLTPYYTNNASKLLPGYHNHEHHPQDSSFASHYHNSIQPITSIISTADSSTSSNRQNKSKLSSVVKRFAKKIAN